MMFLLPVFRPTLIADFPSVNGKSRAEAEGVCNAAIDGNPVLQTCAQRVGLDFTSVKETCVEDYKVLLKIRYKYVHVFNFSQSPLRIRDVSTSIICTTRTIERGIVRRGKMMGRKIVRVC